MSDQSRAGARPAVEELHFRNESVYVCLLVNRRHRTARVMDFLAGNFPQKQAAIRAMALREGVERVYTLVEKEESHGWARAGWTREGAISGYYKRSDAHLMGHLVKTPPDVTPEGVPIPHALDTAFAEKTLVAARKLLPSLEEEGLRGLKAQVLPEAEVAALKLPGKKATGWLEDRFGRSGTRLHVAAKPARPGRSSAKPAVQLVSAELQEPFGNAYVNLAGYPSTPQDARLLIAALGALGEHLRSREVGCMFGVTPAADAVTAAAMLAAGYRKTGLLAQHVVLGDRRADTILWTRRPATSTADADAA